MDDCIPGSVGVCFGREGFGVGNAGDVAYQNAFGFGDLRFRLGGAVLVAGVEGYFMALFAEEFGCC